MWDFRETRKSAIKEMSKDGMMDLTTKVALARQYKISAWLLEGYEALIKRTHEDRLVGHISRDATAIEAREKPVKTTAPEASTSAQPPKRKRGRPRKGEVVEKKEPRRLERQADMSLAEMLSDLPTHCAVGTKRNAKGHTTSWIGYKLHLDVADGDIPISAVLTSASLHDSQAAIPLATMTASRVINLYDLMDRRGAGARPATRLPRMCATTNAAPPSGSMAASRMISAGATCGCAATPRYSAI